MAANVQLKELVHPGRFVGRPIIEARGLSVTDAAGALGATRPSLSKLLNERAPLSPEMGLRIEKAFGVSLDELMALQTNFDVTQVRKRAGQTNVIRFMAPTNVNQRGRPHG